MIQTEIIASITEYASRQTGFAPDEIAITPFAHPSLALDEDEIITMYQIVFPGEADSRSPVLAVAYDQRDTALGTDVRYYAQLD